MRKLSSCILTFVFCLYYPSYPFGSWHLMGMIGSKMKIQMELNSPDSTNEINGTYYYSKYFNTILLRGSINKKTRQLSLSEDSSDARFDLKYNPDFNNFTGIWKNKKKQFNVALTVVASYYGINDTTEDPRDATPTCLPRFCSSVRHYKELNKLISPAKGLPPRIDAFCNNLLRRLNSNEGLNDEDGTDNNSSCEVIYLDSNFLVLKTVNIYCGGGASCSHNHCFMNYDLSRGEPHKMEISEIFSKNTSFSDTLRKLIVANFKKVREFYNEGLGNGLVTKNMDWSCFTMYPRYITFIFPEGEMGPRMWGPVYDSIPWNRIDNLIDHTSALRFIIQE